EILSLAPAANDTCAYVPVMRPQSGYRRVLLRSEQARRSAAAVLLTLAFCAYWFAVRGAAPAEIDAARMQLHADAGATAVARFDAALAAHESPSLLRVHLLRLTGT